MKPYSEEIVLNPFHFFSFSNIPFLYSLSMSTVEATKTEGKKAGPNAPPTHIGWDSHQPMVSPRTDYHQKMENENF